MKREEILDNLYKIRNIIKDMNKASAEMIEASYQIAPIEKENKYNAIRILFLFVIVMSIISCVFMFSIIRLVLAIGCLLYLIGAKMEKSNYVVYIIGSIILLATFVPNINNIMGVLILTIPSAIITFFLSKLFKSSYKKNRDEEIEKNASIYNLIEAQDNFISASKEALQVYVDEFYPSDCLTIGAVQELIKLFENRRADTMKEALNLLDTKMYREKMYESQQRIESMVYNQTLQLANINNQLRWNNAMNIIQLAQLNDIRKNHSQAEIIIKHR